MPPGGYDDAWRVENVGGKKVRWNKARVDEQEGERYTWW